LEADVTDQASVTQALGRAAEANGRIDLVVNAASTYGGTRTGPFGGGPIAEASADAFDSWATAPPRAAFAFLSGAGSFLAAQGGLATMIQVTGGSARRAMPGRGLWAAGAFGVRAITQAAALELRPRGIHVALLIVDAGIQPVSGPPRPPFAFSPAREPRPRPMSSRSRRWQRRGCRRTVGVLADATRAAPSTPRGWVPEAAAAGSRQPPRASARPRRPRRTSARGASGRRGNPDRP